MKTKKKKHNILKKYIPTLIIIVTVGIICFFIGKKIGLNTDTSSTNTEIEDVLVEKQTIKKTLSSSGEVTASTTENLSLSKSYYFDSMCVEEDDIVKKGEKIVKYTNGKYLIAPYDLVVTKINVPTTKTKATSQNYISVSNMEDLVISLNVNESEISNLSIGQEVEITLTADSSKNYTGKISKIGAIGTYSSSGSTFPVTVSLENDGDIKIGMSVSCTINIEELEDVVAVPVGAVQINGDRRYVIVVKGNETEEVDVTTGLADDQYVQIKSGLDGGETVRVITITKQSTLRNSSSDNNRSRGMQGGSDNMQGDKGNFGGEMPNGFAGPNSNGENRAN